MNKPFDKATLEKMGYQETSKGVWEKVGPKKAKVAEKSPKSELKGVKKHKYNAKKVVEDGVKYDSKLELAFKHLLDANGIEYTMKIKYNLQEKFRYLGEAIRAINIFPDFIITKGALSVAIVDTKGVRTEVYKLKAKMLKKKLFEMNHEIPIFTPRNKKQMQETIDELLKLTK